ncbi:MAG: 2Fe-2S iron-sulfur cluster-binding protein [Pyrinomonadaceae bacterium]
MAQSAKKIDSSLLTGITAVAFMTLQQVGLDAFGAAPGTVQISRGYGKRSPEQVLAERATDDSQGLFGFLRKADKKWTVTFNEADDNAWFTAIDQEELASAAARDKSQEWLSVDARRVEGPIPVQCRSAACGTCWVGVLGGAEKLSDVSARENKKIKEFGYIDTSEPKPIIRLACVAQAMGTVSIVIPPWNGVFRKHLESFKGEKAKLDQKSIADESPVVGSRVEVSNG